VHRRERDAASTPRACSPNSNVGALPTRGEDDRLNGMLTDRDHVVKALGLWHEPGSSRAGELGQTVTIGADDSIDVALRTSIDHRVRRLGSSTATSWSASSAKEPWPLALRASASATWTGRSPPLHSPAPGPARCAQTRTG